jgi:cytochrome oxidase Cu insertion factor (SCO1/SenC/PrrC family)
MAPTSPRWTRRPALLLFGALVVALVTAAVLYTIFAPASIARSSAAGAVPSSAAVSFTATTPAGAQVSVPDGKPSAVLFFSATCGTCGPATHALAAAQQADPRGANYVAVDLDPSETPTDIAAFLTANQAGALATTSDTNGQLASTFGVTQLSTAVFLSPDGHVVARTVEPTTTQISNQLHAAAQ